MKRLVTGIFVLIALVTSSASAQVSISAHRSVPISTIDDNYLRDLYTGDIKMWSGGDAVVLVDLKPKTDTKELFYQYMGMSSSRMKSIWMKNMLAGEGDPPQSFESEEALLRHVAATPGAIGYVSLAAAQGATDVITLLEIPTTKK